MAKHLIGRKIGPDPTTLEDVMAEVERVHSTLDKVLKELAEVKKLVFDLHQIVEERDES